MMRSNHLFAMFAFAMLLGHPIGVRAQERIERLEFVNASIKLSGQSSVSGLAMRMHVGSAWVGKNASIVPAIEYWGDSDRFPEFGIDKVTQRDWTFSTDARYHFDIHRAWGPYAGSGLGLHFLRSTIQRPNQPTESDSWTKLGLDVLAGVDFPPAKIIQSSVEIRYRFVSKFPQLCLNWGFGVKF